VPFDEVLADRVRPIVHTTRGVIEKKMFGGLAFLIHGNMSVGVHGADLIVRIDPDETDAMLKEPGARLFDLTGRPMKGWLLVSATALKQKAGLEKWVKRGVGYATALPKK
jgi:TfoX/Sxy family transcriptional regulator of competence genes